MDLSFSGAGFMGCYYFGVVNCWNKYIPRDRVRRVAGASAGSLIAAYYLMDLPLDSCLKEIIEMTEDVRARPLGVFDRSNQIVDVLPRILDKLFPDDAHKRVNGRLFVSMTRLKDMKNVMVNQFDSKQDLIDALNCSCFIPVWSGNHVATYKGVKHIDGGFTNNLPVFDEHTIRISCFSGASDIAPCDKAQMLKFVGQGNAMGMPFHVNWKNLKRGGRALWPPPPSYIVNLLERGFHDTKDFILSNDLIQCDRCFNSTTQPIHSKRRLNPTISPGASPPSVSRASSFLNLSDLHRSNSSKSTKSDDDCCDGGRRNRLSTANNNRSPPRVHIKPHRQQQQPALVALFEQDRSKSGKKIKRKCLERSQSELYRTTLRQSPTCDGDGKQADEVTRVSFATKLREKLVRVASSTGLTTAPATEDNTCKKAQEGCEKHRQMAPMPRIVIEEEEPVGEQQQFDEIEADNDRQIVTIMDIVKAREEQEAEQEDDESQQRQQQRQQQQVDARKNKKQLRTVSESSSVGSGSTSHSSNDSAVGLDATPSPTIKGVSGSPAERFFASSHAARQVRAASLATSAPFTAEQQALLQRALQESQQHLNSLAPARFSAAPSPLPSCPPSPNLNRHCTECIRLRQQARMDGVDESIRREAELYGTIKSKDPEREFNSFRARLTGWLKQLSTPKYSYSFDDDQEQGAEQGVENQTTTPREQRRTAGLRRGSLTVITPPSQIP